MAEPTIRSLREAHDAELIAAVRGRARARRVLGESLDDLPGVVRGVGARRVLLVIDRAAADATGATPCLRTLLGDSLAGEFDGFRPNPTSEHVLNAAGAIRADRADGVVAFGGGSCLDVAKIGALAAANPERMVGVAEGAEQAIVPALPIIAIPTTSGTGSEATHFAAIYVRGRKVSVAHPSARPRAAVLTAELQAAIPPAMAAASGLDALCQSIESLWAAGSTDDSRTDARLGGALIARHLLMSVRERRPASRDAMVWGAHAAGMAIDASKTTAPHALSYPFTVGFGIPHGLAVALTLGWIARANADVTDATCRDPRGPGWVRERVEEAASLLDATPATLASAVRGLLRGLGMPGTLREAGVDRGSLHEIAREVDPVRLSNNPRRLTTDELAALLELAWTGEPV